MDEHHDDDERQRRIQMYKTVVPIFIAISCFGVIANATVVLALRATKVRNATVTLILSLTISDIWTSSIVAFSLFYNSYLPTVQGTQVSMCFSLTLEMLRTGGLITGILHLLLISIHHYIGIVRPYTSKTHLKLIAQCLCVLAWLTPSAVLFALALAFPGEGFWNCEHVHFYYTRAFRWTVSGMLTSIFVIITSAYFRLLRILREQRKKWRCQQLYSVAASTTAMMQATYEHQKQSTPQPQNDRHHSRTKMPLLVRIVHPTRSGNNTRSSVPILYDGHGVNAGRTSTVAAAERDAHDQRANYRMARAQSSATDTQNRTQMASLPRERAATIDSVRESHSVDQTSHDSLLQSSEQPRNGTIRWQSDWKPPSEWNLDSESAKCSNESCPNVMQSTRNATSTNCTTPKNGAQMHQAQSYNAAAEKRAVRENRTLWTTILICSSFFLGWAPATILFTLTCDTCALHNGDQSVLFAFSCTQLCFILGKSLVNPLIYSLRIPEVDSELRFVTQRLFRRIHYLLRWLKHDKKLSIRHKLSQQERMRCQQRILDSPTESLIVGSVHKTIRRGDA